MGSSFNALLDYMKNNIEKIYSVYIMEMNQAIKDLNCLYGNSLREWVFTDKQGWTQPSSNLGPRRQIAMIKALASVGIKAALTPDFDIIVLGFPVEVRGSIGREDYNNVRSGKCHKDYGRQLHILSQEVYNPDFLSVKKLRLTFCILSAKDWENCSNKTNMSVMKLKNKKNVIASYEENK